MGVQAKVAPLDLPAIRERFPALAREIAGRPAVYLDGAGGSQAPEGVIEAMARYLRHSNANLGGSFATSLESDALVVEARTAAADLTGASADEIAFGQNMTTLNFQLAHAVARTLRAGDEIVCTQVDHDANVSPWLQVARDRDLRVRVAPLRPKDGTLDVDALESLVGRRTRVVACALASNAIGTVPDFRAVAEIAHSVGALAWADGVAYAPHRRLDVRALGADVLLCSAYKFFGPHIGLAVIRRDLAERWPADRVRPAAEAPPGHRFETGTLSHEALAGLVAAIDYIAGLGSGATRPERLSAAFERIGAHERELTLHTLDRLADLTGVTLHGIADPARLAERTATFCVSVDGMRPRAAAEALAAEGIFTRDGNYYALETIRALGLEPDGGLRAGYLHYTTVEEVDRLVDALERLAGG